MDHNKIKRPKRIDLKYILFVFSILFMNLIITLITKLLYKLYKIYINYIYKWMIFMNIKLKNTNINI